MDPTLDQLIPVAHLDEQIAERLELQARARRKLAKAIESIAAAEAHLAAQRAALEQLRTEELEHQRELKRAEGMRDSAQRALDAGLGDAAASERQIARCAELIDAAETALLERMDTRETLEAARDAAQDALTDAHAHQDRLKAELEPAIETWAAAVAELQSHRAHALSGVPRDVDAEYHRMFRKHGAALSRVHGDTCKRCARVVPLQRVTDIKQNRLVHCDGCGLWLWIDLAPKEETAAS